ISAICDVDRQHFSSKLCHKQTGPLPKIGFVSGPRGWRALKEAALLRRTGKAATVLARVGKSDLIEKPVARYGVAEKANNHDGCHKRNLCESHVGLQGRTLTSHQNLGGAVK